MRHIIFIRASVHPGWSTITVSGHGEEGPCAAITALTKGYLEGLREVGERYRRSVDFEVLQPKRRTTRRKLR
jgi:hypothetical protein